MHRSKWSQEKQGRSKENQQNKRQNVTIEHLILSETIDRDNYVLQFFPTNFRFKQ